MTRETVDVLRAATPAYHPGWGGPECTGWQDGQAKHLVQRDGAGTVLTTRASPPTIGATAPPAPFKADNRCADLAGQAA